MPLFFHFNPTFAKINQGEQELSLGKCFDMKRMRFIGNNNR